VNFEHGLPVSSELLIAEHAETMEAAVISLHLLLLKHLLLYNPGVSLITIVYAQNEKCLPSATKERKKNKF